MLHGVSAGTVFLHKLNLCCMSSVVVIVEKICGSDMWSTTDLQLLLNTCCLISSGFGGNTCLKVQNVVLKCFCQVFPKKLVSFSMWIDHTRWARNTWAMAAIFILTAADLIDMVSDSKPPGSPRGFCVWVYSASQFSSWSTCLNLHFVKLLLL